jgi:RecJ-like exonuclease
MSRKRNDDAPVFKGTDDQGEPIFAWTPETPAWLRDEYVKAWKASQSRCPECNGVGEYGDGEECDLCHGTGRAPAPQEKP